MCKRKALNFFDYSFFCFIFLLLKNKFEKNKKSGRFLEKVFSTFFSPVVGTCKSSRDSLRDKPLRNLLRWLVASFQHTTSHHQAMVTFLLDSTISSVSTASHVCLYPYAKCCFIGGGVRNRTLFALHLCPKKVSSHPRRNLVSAPCSLDSLHGASSSIREL